MAKEWKLMGTNAVEFGNTRTKDEKRKDFMRKTKRFNRLMATTKVRSYDKMVEDVEKSYNTKIKENADLLQAFADKKLKSKTLIKQAQGLKKKQTDNKISKELDKNAI